MRNNILVPRTSLQAQLGSLLIPRSSSVSLFLLLLTILSRSIVKPRSTCSPTCYSQSLHPSPPSLFFLARLLHTRTRVSSPATRRYTIRRCARTVREHILCSRQVWALRFGRARIEQHGRTRVSCLVILRGRTRILGLPMGELGCFSLIRRA